MNPALVVSVNLLICFVSVWAAVVLKLFSLRGTCSASVNIKGILLSPSTRPTISIGNYDRRGITVFTGSKTSPPDISPPDFSLEKNVTNVA